MVFNSLTNTSYNVNKYIKDNFSSESPGAIKKFVKEYCL